MSNRDWFLREDEDEFGESLHRRTEELYSVQDALSDEDAADIGAYFQAQSLTAAAEADADKAAAGREMYKGGDMQKGIPACQACHGPSGSGTAGIGYPQLGGQYVDYTLAQLKAFKDGTRKNDDKMLMRSIVEKMSDEDMAAVANYIASLK